MTKEEIIWTGDLEDDCTARWHNLMLRAEEMDKNRWWWCVYDMNTNEEQIACSNEYTTNYKSGQIAREAAENAAKLYLMVKDRKIIEDQNIVPKLVELLIFEKSKSSDLELYKNPCTGEEWIRYEYENSSETEYGLYRNIQLLTYELIDIIRNSKFMDEVSGAAGLLLTEEWRHGTEFREKLIASLEDMYKNQTPEISEKIRIVIHRAELLQKVNNRGILGKTVGEIENDFKYFLELAKRAECLLQLVENR